MVDPRTRLIKCFLAVFSQLKEEDVTQASVASVIDWDSVASITLLTVIEEEFSIQLSADDLGSLTSFEKILEYLKGVNTSNVTPS